VVLAALADAPEQRELALAQGTRCPLGEQRTERSQAIAFFVYLFFVLTVCLV
jgi:hypothetical protein